MERNKTINKLLTFLVPMVCCFIKGNAQLTFSVSSLSGSYSITCTHSALTLSASSSYSSPVTYTWTTPLFNTVISNSLLTVNPGLYTITASSGSVLSSQTLAVGSNTAVPTVSIAASSSSLSCLSGTVLLTGIVSPTNVTYTWIKPFPYDDMTCYSNTCIVAGAGNYTLSVTNYINGCTNSATIQINNGQIYPMLGTSNLFTVACPNGTVDLSVSVQDSTLGLSYLWFSPAGAVTNGSNTSVLNTNAPGSYTLQLTYSSNGCSTMTLVSVYACVGIEELILNTIKLFPNPVSEKLYIQFSSDPGSVKVIMNNVLGQEIKTYFINASEWIDFSDVRSGIYFIWLEAGKAKRVAKVIKN